MSAAGGVGVGVEVGGRGPGRIGSGRVGSAWSPLNPPLRSSPRWGQCVRSRLDGPGARAARDRNGTEQAFALASRSAFMNVLLTGGAGYVGSACLRWLLARGHEAVALDNMLDGNRGAVPDSERRLIVGDVRDRAFVAQVLHARKIDVVMHFASLLSVPDSIRDPDSYYDVNLSGTKAVLDAMRDTGVRRIVFSSTAATYGNHPVMPLREDSPQNPVVPYGTTKLAAERLIADYSRAYDIGHVVFRYFNAAGADPDGRHGEHRSCESHLIPLTLGVATGKRPKLVIAGNQYPTRDGTCVRDYVHTADLAQAHARAAEILDPGVAAAYNLGSGEGTTVLEVLRACERAVGRDIPHEIGPPRPGDPPVLIADPSKAMAELGWEPRHADIDEIVRTAWAWHSSHPDGYAA